MARVLDHLEASGRVAIFDAFEQAATHVGLAPFVVHVDATPPVVTYASGALAELVGRPVAELVGRPPWELVATDLRNEVRDLIASRGPGAAGLTTQTEVQRPDGERREIEVGVARISTPGAELAVCYFRDMTEQRRAVRESRRTEAGFRSLVENAPDGVVIVQDGLIVLANPVAIRMFGAENFDGVRGRRLTDLVPPEAGALAARRIAVREAGGVLPPTEYRTNVGTYVEVHAIPYEYEGKPAILAFARDIAERKRMQHELLRADRLAALGTMAATVAHEINNPLTYLRLSLEQLQREVAAEPDPARAAAMGEQIANALHGAERVARIVRDLRARASVGEPESAAPEDVESIDAVEVVERAVKMVEHDLRHRAQLVRRYCSGPALVRAVAPRLEQVVLNLLVNAVQALDGADAGARNEIAVEVDADGAEVRVTIADTGPGIGNRARAFEPFFTTKKTTEGMGLGLTVCRDLVVAMGGHITIADGAVAGTRVVVALPRATAARTAPEAAPASRVEPAPRRLRVLVIDDDELVRKVTALSLAPHHDVELADGGEAALLLLEVQRFDVILCDLMMPHMSGRDVYERVRARFAGLERRIVFVTAGAFIPVLASFLTTVDNLRLSKPFAVQEALDVLRDAHRRALDLIVSA